MPSKDIFAGYIAWEREQEKKRKQFENDVKRGADALMTKRVNRIGAK